MCSGLLRLLFTSKEVHVRERNIRPYASVVAVVSFDT